MISPESSTILFCSLCGTRGNRDEQFCSCCGTKFNLLQLQDGVGSVNNRYNSLHLITSFENKIKGINYLLKLGIHYVYSGRPNKGLKIFSNIFPIINVIFDYPSEVLKKLKKEQETITFYLETIDIILTKWEKLYRFNRLNRFLGQFSDLLNFIEKTYSTKQLKKKEIQLETPLVDEGRISNIKYVIKEFSRRFARLHLAEIVEACDDNEYNVLVVLKEMIRDGEIQARYFKSTRSVVFDIYNII